MNNTTELHNSDNFKERAINAHNWTSFDPKKRGEQIIQAYSEQLKEDIGTLQNSDIKEDIIQGYAERYKRLFSSWIHAKSGCASSVITGGSGFNVRRAEKANRSEQRHFELWQEWRSRAIKAILRKEQPKKTNESELTRYREQLNRMQANHVKMKEGNARIKKAIKTGEDITEYLKTEFNIEPHMIEWTLRWGFGLANNNANIKRVEARIKELERKEEAKEKTGGSYTLLEKEGVKVIVNFEADRIQVIHDSKPSEEIRTLLKKNAFKYAPSNSCWQRQITQNSISITKQLINQL
jgi:hypothetical protein